MVWLHQFGELGPHPRLGHELAAAESSAELLDVDVLPDTSPVELIPRRVPAVVAGGD